MKRKGNILLVFSIMFITIFLIPMKVQADPDPRFWHWIGSTDEVGFFVSTKRPIKYSTGVKQWVMQVEVDGSHSVALNGFRWNSGKEYALLHITYYDSDGKVTRSFDTQYIEWSVVIPGSYGESIWDYVNSQVMRM